MINKLWIFLILIGIVFGVLSGNIEVINNSILLSGGKAFDLVLSLLPTIVLWSGIMKIAEDSGILEKFAVQGNVLGNKCVKIVSCSA